MSDQGLASAELARLQCELERTRAEFEAFVYTVSHDLRAPLRHIRSYAQIIAEDLVPLPVEIASHLCVIGQSAQLLTRQLDGLTALSRLQRQTVHCVPVNVEGMLARVVDSLAQVHADRDMQWDIAPGCPVVLADEGLLREVFEALLDNACKFTRARSPACVAVSWAVDEGACAIRVQDNGVGFDPALAPRLFQVFSRLHSVHEFEGLGLGLVQCRKMVERMHGQIDIQAKPDAGCCVTLTLPLATSG